MRRSLPVHSSRGAAADPSNRFERMTVSLSPEEAGEEPCRRRTEYLRDPARTVLTQNRSPDVGFDWSLNPYRGCEHGCVYCYARPSHEYLGFSPGLDFESRILVKEDAPALLRDAIRRPGWNPVPLAMSGITDPYQPVERRLGITRACLEILEKCGHPVALITKNRSVTRDVDLLASLARREAAAVTISITTLDRDLQRAMEPRTSSPGRRLEAVEVLARAGVPVGVNVAPVIPGLTEEEIPAILSASAAAGATSAGYVLLRLPHAVSDLFADWLSRCLPGRKGKILNRIRASRAGRMNDPRFGTRMRGEGIFAEQIGRLFEVECRRSGLDRERPSLSTSAFRRPQRPRGTAAAMQGDLFDSVIEEV